MSEVIYLLNHYQPTEADHQQHIMHPGDKFFIDRRRDTLLEFEKTIDHDTGDNTLCLVMHLLKFNRKLTWPIDKQINWVLSRITPLRLKTRNGKPLALQLTVEQFRQAQYNPLTTGDSA